MTEKSKDGEKKPCGSQNKCKSVADESSSLELLVHAHSTGGVPTLSYVKLGKEKSKTPSKIPCSKSKCGNPSQEREL